jgi:hypothetical protein
MTGANGANGAFRVAGGLAAATEGLRMAEMGRFLEDQTWKH